MPSRSTIIKLIIFALAINSLGLFEPLLRNDDPVLYANIVKHMLESGNWIDLISGGRDWLDKPHFPFWVTAVSFKLLGINSLAYMLPGFIFHILGLIYTYKLGKYLYNQETGLIAALIYATSLHLMLSAVDVRAEAYLLGEIVPACYYWLVYDRNSSPRALLWAAVFTALAMMTKGLFVVITIFSGLVFSWIYTKQAARIISRKWIIAYGLCLVGILPELISLYLQFDSHPEKVIFGQTHVSGIAWYFWGSQFGRFFNSGPIVHKDGNPFFYLHTFLWAFLPWCLVFIVAMYQSIRNFKQTPAVAKAKLVYLWASFWVTFIIFSATKFQLDHYTNILMPFAAILCAAYLSSKINHPRLAAVQVGLSGLLALLSIGLTLYLFKMTVASLIIALPLAVLWSTWRYYPKCTYLAQIMIFPALAITSTLAIALLVNQVIYRPYDVGYRLAQYINHEPLTTVYDLGIGWTPLEFHSQIPYTQLENIQQLPESGSYYVAIKDDNLARNQSALVQLQLTPAYHFCGNTIDKIIPFYANKIELARHLDCYTLLKRQ